MKVFVAGGTGAIGRRLVPQLAARGHEVTASTRSADKFGLLHELGADAVVMDGLDAVEVQDVVAHVRPDAIVHQMTALSRDFDLKRFDDTFAETNALRTDGTRNLIDAALANGVRRFVAQSYTNWTNARRGAVVKTEEDPLDDDPAPNQRRTLEAIRQLEESVLAAPLEGIVLRYGNLYGAGASDELVELVRRRRIPLIGEAGGVWSWVHVEDAAAATVAAVERGTPGVYNVVDDDPAPVREWLPALASALGAPEPRRVPAWLARPLAGEAAVRWMTEGRGASNEKALASLGWQPRWRTWREGFEEAVAA
jgi:nucleoside-diphosphate-sugar epimerase